MPNEAEASDARSAALFEKYRRFRHLLTEGLAAHGDVALERHPPPVGGRVLDVGCGMGDTTLAIARRVGAEGEAVGVDCVRGFVDAATEEAAAAGVRNARYLTGDAQRCELEGPYDHAFSRLGTMFFESPVAALAHVRSALRKDATLCMVVWRRLDENGWAYVPLQVVRSLVPLPAGAAGPKGGPGPFSMADADVVSGELLAAGYRDVAFERIEAPMRVGRDLDEALAFALAMGPAGELLRLAGEEGARRKPAILPALREALAPFAQPDGVYAPSSTWIVSARA